MESSLSENYDRRRGRNGEALRVDSGELLPARYGGNGAVDGMEEDAAEPMEETTRLDGGWSDGEQQLGLARVAEPSGSRGRRCLSGLRLRGTAAEDLLDAVKHGVATAKLGMA
ncbi:hypothetical protein E2562_029248 [Oryza meyeriana var. granulata]|uniref:DUF834 domain-containing protein n=1 Tax=Oryza meyeriana var. granulata TaxID=110450 RepID=A0A6G1ER08_9ORYZ|nr:hypothetical protein E2562_029248 [Oryza meyeriana var. granulata]